MRKLYRGDNLEVLRRSVPDDSVDLIYLDPPFNSKRAYTLLHHPPSGKPPGAQVTAFEDTWFWGEQTEKDFTHLLHQPNPQVAALLPALRSVLKTNGMMAYLVMMATRLLELHRVLKQTGSVYLHCDASASHYLKIVMDAVFGPQNFRNEIVWHYYNKYSAGKRIFPRSFDQILFYSKSDRYHFKPLRELRDRPVRQLIRENVGGVLKNKKDADGRTMTRTVHDRKVDAVWRIPCLQFASPEFLGYPTQKPLALLERIIEASSKPGDTVLDPFCGCGSALHAAEKLERGWIGIDSAHLAIGLNRTRLTRAFPNVKFETHGVPNDPASARLLAARDADGFKNWVCWLVGARPQPRTGEGTDGEIDGVGFFQEEKQTHRQVAVSVHSGKKANVGMVRKFRDGMEKEGAALGLFVTLSRPSAAMLKEAAGAGIISATARNSGFPRLQILTVAGLLDGSEVPQPVHIEPNAARGTQRKTVRPAPGKTTQQELDLGETRQATRKSPAKKRGGVVKMRPAARGGDSNKAPKRAVTQLLPLRNSG